MNVRLSKNELKSIRGSLTASRKMLEDATLIALRDIKDNPHEYFRYSDCLAEVNLLIEKIERYLNNEHNH